MNVPQAGESGQVTVIAVGLIGALLMMLCFVYQLGTDIAAKIELANALDAGAQTGGAVLAAALNTEAILNELLVTVIGDPGLYDLIRTVQDALRTSAPYLAMSAAVIKAVQNGADVAIPLNYLGGAAVPDLEIRRGFNLFGLKIEIGPMRDVSRKKRRFPYGKRFVILGGWKERPPSVFSSFLERIGAKRDGAFYGISESAVHGKGLLYPNFKATLVKFHPGKIQYAIDCVKVAHKRRSKKQNESEEKATNPDTQTKETPSR